MIAYLLPKLLPYLFHLKIIGLVAGLGAVAWGGNKLYHYGGQLLEDRRVRKQSKRETAAKQNYVEEYENVHRDYDRWLASQKHRFQRMQENLAKITDEIGRVSYKNFIAVEKAEFAREKKRRQDKILDLTKKTR